MKNVPKSLHNLADQYEKTISKMNLVKSNTKTIQNLMEQVSNLEGEMKFVKQEMTSLRGDILTSQERLEQTIRTQEEIIMDMINKFNEELLQHKSSMKEDIENLKSQQDILKISYTINEKKFMDKVNSSISTIIRKQVEGKENEILMKIWISEFKEIIRDFEKLKKLKPKEFSVRLNEISDTIDIFKQKIMS
jgi:predicted RNase H-like nuclease (RuvC/YqgF family)